MLHRGATAQSTTWTWQIQTVAITARAWFAGGGIGWGWRGKGRLGATVSSSVGSWSGDVGVRTEATTLFSLDPGKRRGLSLYGGGGVAWVVSAAESEGYILLLVGIESAPASRRGWFAEVGVGGGLRGSIGVRLRRRSGPE